MNITSFKTVLTLSLLLVSPHFVFASSSQIEQSLLTKISKAQAELSKTESKIAQEQAKLTKQMESLEHQLVDLEKKAVTARKIADEKNLNLNQLQDRLQKWQSQQTYQQNLLQQFLRLHTNDLTIDATVEQKLAFVSEISAQVEHWFEPEFKPSQLVSENGEIVDTKLISYGPTHWMLTKDSAYRSEKIDGEWIVQQRLSDDMRTALLTLDQGKPTALHFDPSLSKLTQVPTESLVEHVHKGGIWLAPILTFALVALIIAIGRGFALWRLPKIQAFSSSALTSAVRGESSLAKMGKMQTTLFNTALAAQSDQERDDLLFQQLQQDKVTLEKRLTAIAVTASVAPLLGLLGTVSGMIETFRMMTLFGSGDPEVVSGGIAQALITTEIGLVVAIPALIIHAILSRRAKAYHCQLENFALMLSQTNIDINHKEAA